MAEEKKTTLEEAAEEYSRGLDYYHYTGDDPAIAFVAGAEWQKEQMRVLIEKWQEHAIRGMMVGNVSYFQGRVALCVELLENLKEAGK